MKVNQKIVSVGSKASIASSMFKIMSGLLLAFVMGTATSLWCGNAEQACGVNSQSNEFDREGSPVLLSTPPYSPACDGWSAEQLTSFVSALRGDNADCGIQQNQFACASQVSGIEDQFGSNLNQFQPLDGLVDQSAVGVSTAVDVSVVAENSVRNGEPCVVGRKRKQADSGVPTAKRACSNNEMLGEELSFNCDFAGCGYTTNKKSTLKQHQGKHVTERLKCDWPAGCSYETNNPRNLCDHRRKHTAEHLKCDWPDCAYTTLRKYDLVEHGRTHTKEMPFICDFPLCNFSTARQKNLTVHKRKKHAVDQYKFEVNQSLGELVDQEILFGDVNFFERVEQSAVGVNAAVDVSVVAENNVRNGEPCVVKEKRNRGDSDVLVVKRACADVLVVKRACADGLVAKKDCIDCKKTLSSERGKKQINCHLPGCDFSTFYPDIAGLHRRIHTGEILRCGFSGCIYTALCSHELEEHTSRRHAGQVLV